jgi:hypothetical protein
MHLPKLYWLPAKLQATTSITSAIRPADITFHSCYIAILLANEACGDEPAYNKGWSCGRGHYLLLFQGDLQFVFPSFGKIPWFLVGYCIVSSRVLLRCCQRRTVLRRDCRDVRAVRYV